MVPPSVALSAPDGSRAADADADADEEVEAGTGADEEVSDEPAAGALEGNLNLSENLVGPGTTAEGAASAFGACSMLAARQ